MFLFLSFFLICFYLFYLFLFIFAALLAFCSFIESLLLVNILFVAPGSPAGKNPEGSFGGPKSHSVGEHRPRGTRQHELRKGGAEAEKIRRAGI